MARVRFVLGLVTGMVTAGTIALSQASIAVAKAIISPQEIQQIAKPMTVQLLVYAPKEGGSQFGSGVLISKKGNSYAVLTNRHVVCALTEIGACDKSVRLQIRTANGKLYTVDSMYTFEAAKGNPDFAIVFFQSNEDYPIATIGTANQLQQNDLIWINGYPGRNDLQPGQEPLEFHKGFLSYSTPDPHGEGYTLNFSSIGAPGMSGSPLFDASGRVIGIFGQTARTGFLAGIPIDTILAIVNNQPSPRDRLNLTIDTSALTGTRPNLSNPQSADDYYLMGVLQLEKENLQGAIAHFSTAIQLNPDLMIAYRHRAEIRAALGDREGAMNDFKYVLKLTPDQTDAFDARARLRLQWNDYQGAINDWSQAIELDPRGANFLFNRAMTHSIMGNFSAAIQDFTQGIRFQPKDAMAYRERGRSYLGMNNLSAALEDLNRAIELDSSSSLAFGLRGFIRLSMSDYRGALEDCDQAIVLDAKNALAYSDRGFTWLMLGNAQKAYQDASAAIRLDPNLTAAYTARAMAAESQGNVRGAIADYETVTQNLEKTGQTNSKMYQNAVNELTRLRGKVRSGVTSEAR